MGLFTKDGEALQQRGDKVYNRYGEIVGKISDNKVYGPSGQYVGTLVGSRLVYRYQSSNTISSPFSASNIGGSGNANSAASAIWGEEPDIYK